MRRIACLLVLLAAPAAIAQDAPGSDSTDYMRYRDEARDLQVMTVRRDGDHFIYDIRGGDEDEAVLWTHGSAFVVHGIDAGHVMVVVEPKDGVAGRLTPEAVFLSPSQQAQQITPTDYAFDDLGYENAAFYTVHVLRCADDGLDSPQPMTSTNACQNWERVVPKSGGDGLTLILVMGPELGGGQNRPDDD